MTLTPVLLALGLDAIMGEPRWLWSRLPHPAVLMGRAVGWADVRFNAGGARRLKGVAVMAGLAIGAIVLGALLAALPGHWAEVIVGGILLAQRSLTDHVNAVGKALRKGLTEGRAAVALIVSRDTRDLTESEVTRAALESAAENLSDGVIAPAFWFIVGGLPGLLLYKITNTADSMVGYRTERHEAFGWAAARFDDLLNLIPARLTALLIWASGGFHGRWWSIRADAGLHKSPNAGWPEAALSRALGVALAGPRSYHGERRAFPWVNETGRHHIWALDIDRAVRLLWWTWASFAGLVAMLILLGG